jgi:anti-sigma factor RsiW
VTCDDVLHLVEAIAAEDLEVVDAVRAHFETCPRCAAALAAARRVELLLQSRPVAPPPPRFTATVVSRIRNDRWQVEQRVDRFFNLAIVAAVVVVVGAVAAMINLGVVIDAAAWTWESLSMASRHLADEAVPMLVTYVAAALVLMSALGMWWWADRRLSL